MNRLFQLLSLALMTSASFALHPGEQHWRPEVTLERNDPFARLDDDALPSPNQFRTASGAPGPEYWQQRADYRIEATLDVAEHRVIGSGPFADAGTSSAAGNCEVGPSAPAQPEQTAVPLRGIWAKRREVWTIIMRVNIFLLHLQRRGNRLQGFAVHVLLLQFFHRERGVGRLM